MARTECSDRRVSWTRSSISSARKNRCLRTTRRKRGVECLPTVPRRLPRRQPARVSSVRQGVFRLSRVQSWKPSRGTPISIAEQGCFVCEQGVARNSQEIAFCIRDYKLLCRALIVGDVAKNASRLLAHVRMQRHAKMGFPLIIGKESLTIETTPSLGYRISRNYTGFSDWIGIVVPRQFGDYASSPS